ncbi:putative N-acetylglucosaminyl transferase [Thioflavicoccus mobilis 8321]|uniref:Lipopolysaccharide assembly protein B n=1 Tax=Thioflavicoccus mobilis 8321 TaxID=765912 RepID=L0GUR8_9GAMM|nr:lipopolysaccharide assembly protein LapB [Thioflavicoccus mobilis]AGA90488.1 putative N-acetylglucosaminyl transferase [Thioflavicoccus mobilis 8321]
MTELLFLLLPVAAASGWWVAQRSQSSGVGAAAAKDPAFFRGLNYLLDEQPDKAIDVFLKLAEVDEDTVETHLALGSLFRRRGEVERAIRIHQNLVARSNLDPVARGFALYELGQDYMRAGLLDRAESLFQELLELKLQPERALRALLEIYQQEKDWVRCLEVAEQLRTRKVAPMGIEIAQYHCELAEKALREGDSQAVVARLGRAQESDPGCARALLLRAELASRQDDSAGALDLYRRVVREDRRFFPEILPGLLACFADEDPEALISEFFRLYRDQPSPALMLSLVEAVREGRGEEAAIELLSDYLKEKADLAGLARLLELRLARADGREDETARVSLGVLRHLLARRPGYWCEHCGFTARRLHWQCPSCKRWKTIRPVEPEPIAVRTEEPTSAAPGPR